MCHSFTRHLALRTSIHYSKASLINSLARPFKFRQAMPIPLMRGHPATVVAPARSHVMVNPVRPVGPPTSLENSQPESFAERRSGAEESGRQATFASAVVQLSH